MHPASRTVALLRHPDTPCAALDHIEAEVGATAAGLALAYRLWGRVEALRLPAPQPPGAADGLWAHTCCEAFLAAAGGPAYREFNFSPSGQWAAYAFSDYRQRDEFAPAATPQIALRRFPDRLELDALLAPALLPAGPLELGLACVVEEADGRRSYWALAHPADKPDFHRRAAFALRLPATIGPP